VKIKILLITNKTDITCDFIVKHLVSRKLSFYRLNTEEIGKSLQICFNVADSKYTLVDNYKKISIDLLSVKSVYFRRPEINNEFTDLTPGERNFVKSELIFTLEGLYKILDKAYWINNVQAIRNAENKIFQLLLAKEIGFDIPNSIISNIPSEVHAFYKQNNDSCIIKPIKSGLVEGVEEEGVIFTNKVHINDRNIDRIKSCPTYLQNLIPKRGDVRVTIVGNIIFAALIHSQESAESQIDWRKSPVPLKHTRVELPKEINQKCLQLVQKLGLVFAAIDFILDKNNNYIFLEINPNGQWAWVEKQLNFKISDEITNLLDKN